MKIICTFVMVTICRMGGIRRMCAGINKEKYREGWFVCLSHTLSVKTYICVIKTNLFSEYGLISTVIFLHSIQMVLIILITEDSVWSQAAETDTEFSWQWISRYSKLSFSSSPSPPEMIQMKTFCTFVWVQLAVWLKG